MTTVSVRDSFVWFVGELNRIYSSEGEEDSQVLLNILRIVEEEWTLDRETQERIQLHHIWEAAKSILNQPSKFQQLEMDFSQLLDPQRYFTREKIVVQLQTYTSQWKPICKLLDKENVKNGSESTFFIQTAEKLFRKHTLGSGLNALARYVLIRVDDYLSNPFQAMQDFFSLVALKRSVLAMEVYASHKQQQQEEQGAALLLAMAVTSLDVTVFRDKLVSFYQSLTAVKPEEVLKKQSFWTLLVSQLLVKLPLLFDKNEDMTLKDSLVSIFVSVLVEHISLPEKIAGRRDGVHYSCSRLKLSSFSIPFKSVEVEWISATKCVRMRAGDISASISKLWFSAQQEYFPYLQAEGETSCLLRGIQIACEFQLTKLQNVIQLRLKSCVVSMNTLPELEFSQDLYFFYLVKDLLSATLQRNLIQFLQDEVQFRLGNILEDANHWFASQAYPLLTSLVEFKLESLPSVEESFFLNDAFESRRDLYSLSLVGVERDVVAFEQKEDVILVSSVKKEWEDRIKVGDVLVGCNGLAVGALPLDRIRSHFFTKPAASLLLTLAPQRIQSPVFSLPPPLITVEFKEEKLLLLMKPRKPEERDVGAVVSGFRKDDKGNPGPAERAQVPLDYILCAINGESMLQFSFKETIARFTQCTQRPMTLSFCRNPDISVSMKEPVLGMHCIDLPDHTVVVSDFSLLDSPGEKLFGDQIKMGDAVVNVDGEDTTRLSFEAVIDKLRRIIVDPQKRPVKLGVGAVTAYHTSGLSLGMVFYREGAKCVFKAYQQVESPLAKLGVVRPGLVLVSVNGKQVQEASQAKAWLESPLNLPLQLLFRDMEAFTAGNWNTLE